MSHRVRIKTMLVLFILPCIFIVSFAIPASASGAAEFNNANRLYEEGKYQEALTEYLKLEKNVMNWKVFFNAGNCYFKRGEYVKAKVYYLRAQRLAPFEPSIEKNMELTDLRFADKIPVPPPDFLERLNRRIQSVLPLNMVSWLLVLATLVLNLFVFLLVKNGRTRFRLYGVAFSLLFFIIVVAYYVQRVDSYESRNIAVVIQSNARLRSGPGENNTELFRVNPGLKVRIVDKSRDWAQVMASEQVAGWIREESLERI